jgi:hypothetical protein
MMIMIRAMMKEMGSKLSGIGDDMLAGGLMGWWVDVGSLGLCSCGWTVEGGRKDVLAVGMLHSLYLVSMGKVCLGERGSWGVWGVRQWQA